MVQTWLDLLDGPQRGKGRDIPCIAKGLLLSLGRCLYRKFCCLSSSGREASFCSSAPSRKWLLGRGGDQALMRHWIDQPNRQLGEQPPRLLVARIEGLNRVANYLDALRG